MHNWWHTPTLLERLKCKSKSGNSGRKRSWARSLAHNILGVEGRVGASRWGLKWLKNGLIIHTNLHKSTTSWLMCGWSTFDARMNYGHTCHKIHHDLDLGEAITFDIIVFSMHRHRVYTQISFCPGTTKLGVPKFPKLGLLQFWRLITFHENLWLGWGLKKNYSPSWELLNDMWHATCTQVHHGDSQPFFDHNLCFKYSNGMCEPISDIYVSRAFQWYKEFFDPMNFDPCNSFLKIWESIDSPKWVPTWECVSSFPHTLLHSRKHAMWLLGFSLDLHLCKPLLWSQAQG
jgi:hypothetical protein